ncbi:hypothetical protein UNSWDHB_210 [Dehalobacter sp. UNSWDHB]|nr:hypothetical protein [Dehalobacter sp. UNSWDHB]EQB22834.1 hypothetical protein UNSWDHB_210 [Dehalobacter sp. UNSWDHB]
MSDMEMIFKMARERILSQFLHSDQEKDGIESALTIVMLFS